MLEKKAVLGKVSGIAFEAPKIGSTTVEGFAPGEQAEQLWGLFRDYQRMYHLFMRRKIDNRREDPTMQKLAAEVRARYDTPEVRRIFEETISESLDQVQRYPRHLRRLHIVKDTSVGLEGEYQRLLSDQFASRSHAPTLLALEIHANRASQRKAAWEIDYIERYGFMQQDKMRANHGLDHENSQIAALASFERVIGYHRELSDNGFVLTPSRVELLDDVVEKTASGSWVLLVGETGTGKSTFAKRASGILNHEPPQYASGEKWGDARTLIGTRTIDGNGGVYYEFGPLLIALTGCYDSRQMASVIKSGQDIKGKILQLDELNKFDQDALMGALNLASTYRPGETFNIKELPGIVLKKAKTGSGIIATMNPASVRYDRKELDPSIERRFAEGRRNVDYLPMDSQNPELYEVFLAALMDDNSRIRIAKSELSPAFVEVRDNGITKTELDTDVKNHGVLYRFALAAAEIHKSFTHKDSVAKTQTDDGFLERTVLDMEILVKWMVGYHSQIEGGLSLTTYLEKKLNEFYLNMENDNDKAIFERVFDHFDLNIVSPRHVPKPPFSPMTPLEMGYLSPKTPREVKKTRVEVKPGTKIYIDPDDGTEREYLDEPLETRQGEFVHHGGTVTNKEGKEFTYIGLNPNTKKAIVIPK